MSDTALINIDAGGHFEYHYAGFWWRFKASMLDFLISNIIVFISAFIIGVAFGAKLSPSSAESFGAVIGIIVSFIYYTAFESSFLRATPGKMICGLKVVDKNGNKLTYGRAVSRHISKIISLITLGIGFLMAGFTKKKQTLHDFVAGSLVLRRVRQVETISIKAA